MRQTTKLVSWTALALASALASSGCTQAERHFGNSGGAGGGGGAATSSSSSSSSGGASSSSSTSSSSSSTSSSSSSTSSSSSSTSSGGGTELDCTNGLDDDSDGFTDCEDPDCTAVGYQCAEPAPSGWSGPAVLYAGLGAPPECGSDWKSLVVSGGLDVSSPLAGCSACTCSTPTGMGCDGGTQVTVATDPACGNGPTVFNGYGQCTSPFQGYFVSVSPPKALGGGCTPAGGAPNLPPANFKAQAAVCAAPAATGSGCAMAGACVAKAPTGYGSSLCIFTPDDVPCPSGPYGNRTVVFGAIDDQRGCSACACDPPAGGTCKTSFLAFNSPFPGCQSPTGTYPANGSCFNVGGSSYTSVVVQPPGGPSGGSCGPSGGDPIGAASGGQPTTVCCQ